MLPYYDDVEGAPQNSIIGGATLWVLQGKPDDHYAGVAAFFEYLSRPEVQADWHQFSGYLPITQAAYELGKEQGYYEKNPGRDIGIKQITLNPPTENSKGLRFGNFVQIRDIISEEMEQVLSGQEGGQHAALDAVGQRGNHAPARVPGRERVHTARADDQGGRTPCVPPVVPEQAKRSRMQTKRTTFPQPVAALCAGRAAAGGHAGVLHLARRPGARQSVLRQDAFGLKTNFVGLANFARLFGDPYYLNSMQVTAVFAVSVDARCR